jgi:hypothetical protein
VVKLRAWLIREQIKRLHSPKGHIATNKDKHNNEKLSFNPLREVRMLQDNKLDHANKYFLKRKFKKFDWPSEGINFSLTERLPEKSFTTDTEEDDETLRLPRRFRPQTI